MFIICKTLFKYPVFELLVANFTFRSENMFYFYLENKKEELNINILFLNIDVCLKCFTLSGQYPKTAVIAILYCCLVSDPLASASAWSKAWVTRNVKFQSDKFFYVGLPAWHVPCRRSTSCRPSGCELSWNETSLSDFHIKRSDESEVLLVGSRAYHSFKGGKLDRHALYRN